MSETTERKEDSQKEEARSHPETRRGGTWRARERSSDCTLTTKGSYGTEHRVGDIFYHVCCMNRHILDHQEAETMERSGGRLLQWSE